MPSCYLLRVRQGLEADRLGYTPLEGEFIFTTDTHKLYVGDGSTAGGLPPLTYLGLGTMASQDATAVNIDGGNIDGTPIGTAVKAIGKFTQLVGDSIAAGTSEAVLGTSKASFHSATGEMVALRLDGWDADDHFLVKVTGSPGTETYSLAFVDDSAGTETVVLQVTASGISVNGDLEVSGNITAAGGASVTGQLTASGTLLSEQVIQFSGITTSSALTTQQDDLPIGTASLFRFNADADLTLTGIAGGSGGRKLWLSNIGTGTITIPHQSASSLAANRFDLLDDTDIKLGPGGELALDYDPTTAAWRVVGGVGGGAGFPLDKGNTYTASAALDTSHIGLTHRMDDAATSAGYTITLPDITTVGEGDSIAFIGQGGADREVLLTTFGTDIVRIDRRTYSTPNFRIQQGDFIHLVKMPSAGGSYGDFTWVAVVHTFDWVEVEREDNLLLNGRFEGGIIGWSVYDDSTADPVNGSGGAPTEITFTHTLTTPIQGNASALITKAASNAQGEGVSIDFGIFPYMKGSVGLISFATGLASGSYQTGDLTAWIYDVSNAQMYPLGDVEARDGTHTYYFAFTQGTVYRLILHWATTGTTAATIYLDDVFVGPNREALGFAGSEWIDDGPVQISATTTPPTKGTTTADSHSYSRIGQGLAGSVIYKQSVAGSGGTGTYLFTLPASLSINTALVPVGTIVGKAKDDAPWQGWVEVYDSTHLIMRIQQPSNNPGLVGSTFQSLSAATRHFFFEYFIPAIAGWSAQAPVASLNQPYLLAERLGGSFTVVTTTPSKLGEVRAERRNGTGTAARTDTTPTGSYVPSKADGFRIKRTSWGTSGTVGEVGAWTVHIGKGNLARVVWYANAGRSGFIDASPQSESASNDGMSGVYEMADENGNILLDAITVISGASGSGYAGMVPGSTSGNATAYFDILVTPKTNPLAMQKEALVHVEATSDAGQALTANVTNIQREDEVVDTHGAWSTDTFTAPRAGEYLLEIAVAANSTAAFTVDVYKNGSQFRKLSTLGGINWTNGGSKVVRLAAGDTITFRVDASITQNTTSTQNWLSITEIR
jgi:hypothetical protein